MRKILAVLLVALMATAVFTGCGNKKEEDSENVTVTSSSNITDVEGLSDYDYTKFKGQNITLNVSNWGEYLSINDPESLDVNRAFEKLTGVKVNYKTIETNEAMYSKLKGSGADYDIVIPSDYMISKMIEENMLQKLDFNNIPNIKLIDDKFKNPEYDTTNEYSVPYMWGIVGIVYNKKMVSDPVDSWSMLWEEKYKNNILMFDNPRDAFGLTAKKLGFSLNTTNSDELKQISEELKKQKPLVQAYVMDQIFDKMEKGSSAVGVYYGGDILTMMENNPDLDYVIPKEGTNRFVDAMCIPSTAKNKEVAEMYINFLCETQVALANCEVTGYSTPQTETYKLLDDELRTNPLVYPSDEYLEKNTEAFINLPEDTSKELQALWTDLKINQSTNKWLIFIFIGALAAVAVVISVIRKKKKKEADY